jgi:hypothetical protein
VTAAARDRQIERIRETIAGQYAIPLEAITVIAPGAAVKGGG